MKKYTLQFLMIAGLSIFSSQLIAGSGGVSFLKEQLVVDAPKLDTLKADAKDPVCGMPVKKGSTLTTSYQNKVYGFCGKSCQSSFLKQPEKYAKTKAKK